MLVYKPISLKKNQNCFRLQQNKIMKKITKILNSCTFMLNINFDTLLKEYK